MNTNNSTEGYLTKEEILEFQRLCKELRVAKLSYSEAEDQGTRLIKLFELFLHPNKVALEKGKP